MIDPTVLGGPLPGVDEIQVDQATPANDTTIDEDQGIDTDTTPADNIDPATDKVSNYHGQDLTQE